MKILAVDTALRAASACVYDDAADLFESVESLPMERGHAEALLPLVDRVMARVEGGFPALARVAVSVGPGSFTGLRVGLAAARAIGLACDIPVVGVSTLAALAAPLIMERRPEIVAVAIDARHGQIYFAGFEPGGRALSPPRLAPLAAAAAELAAADAALRRHGLGLGPETGEIEPLVRVVGSAPSCSASSSSGAARRPRPCMACSRPTSASSQGSACSPTPRSRRRARSI
ncbi:tRNA (adenosine(37)-N6)-threonylcarbamoyltransferase complex dimerization subunit type 1 TsaB [Methylocella sp.]|uniref:tRNA (adenosine(37)-N6)-threonylcarbamoyltransferase complex dimerization subunit type 1 TsaB n=1 Tax=Methylocella sp. TaxID=1978226 RepID=UPI00378344F3